MDTYKRGRRQSMYNPVIKRLIRPNWFITKEKVDEIIRTIKLERERKRTNFYVYTGKRYKKHEIYVQWVENANKTINDGYWHVMLGNEIESHWILDRKSAEIEAAKKIYFAWRRAPNMEMIRMVSFEEGQAYHQCRAQNNFYEFWDFVKEHLKKNNIKMTGAEHQEYGVPIIENNGSVYAFTLSYSNWGELMAQAFEPDNKDESALLK